MAQEKQDVLYIPGLGNRDTVERQQRMLRLINAASRTRTIHFFDPEWENPDFHNDPSGAYEHTLQRLLDFYDRIGRPKKGFAVSAGGSLMVTLASRAEGAMERVILSCAKLKNSSKIGPDFQERSAILLPAVQDSEAAIASHAIDDTTVIECFVPILRENDKVLDTEDMFFEGAVKRPLPPFSHLPAIITSFVYLPRM